MGFLTRLAICISLLSVPAAVLGQTFHLRLGSATANEAAQCTQATPDGNYVIGGSRNDSSLIIKVNPAGSVLWSRCFKTVPGFPNLIYQIAATPDGYLIGCGTAYTSGNLYGKTFLFKFDLAGNMIWQSHSADTRPIWTHRIIPTSTAQYMTMSEVYDTSSPTWSDPCIGMVNATTGLYSYNNPRLNYIQDNTYIDDISSAVLGRGQTVYSCGRTYLSGSSPSGMRAFITKFGPSGAHIWSKYLMFPAAQGARIYGCDIAFSDDSLLTCYTGDINGASSAFSVGLIRTDTLGNVAWTRDYKLQGYGSASAFSVLRMPYGHVITGYCVAGTHRDLFVIATGPTGQVLWAKTYGDNSYSTDLFHPYTEQAIAIGSDIMLAGTLQSPGNSDIILARIDASGNIDCGTGTPVNVTVTDIPPYSSELTPAEYPDLLTFTPTANSISEPQLNNLCASVQLDLGPDTAACGPVSFDAFVPGASYIWSDGSSSPSITVNGSDTVWVIANVDCCTYTDTVIISTGVPGAASFSVPSPSCDLSVSMVNSSVGAVSYQWDFGDGQVSSEAEPTHAYGAAGTYAITLTTFSACGTNDTLVQVVIYEAGTFNISGPDTLCANQDGAFSSSLSNATLSTITWSSGADSNSILFASTASTILYAVAMDTNNCTYSDTISLHIDSAPQAAFTFAALPCDTVITFLNESTNATDHQWDLGNGVHSNLASPIGHYDNFGTFMIQLIELNACGSDTIFHPLALGPTGNMMLEGPDSLCANESGTYSISLQGADVEDVHWSLSTSNSTIVALYFTHNSLLDVTVSGSDGCTYHDDLLVQVSPLPIASFSIVADPCDSTAELLNISQSADTYFWDFGNGETSNSPSPTSLFDPSEGEVITLVAFNDCGVDTAQQLLDMDPVPQLTLVGPRFICSDKPVEFHIAYSGPGLHNIHWSTGDTTATILTSPEDGESIVVTASDDHGCLLGSTYPVHYIGDGGSGSAYIPNVFTPNEDGMNESFAPVIKSGFISMEIFNRWGQEIYETQDVNKPWHGDHKDAQVPDGTYVYIVKWKDQCTENPESRIGHVTVLR